MSLDPERPRLVPARLGNALSTVRAVVTLARDQHLTSLAAGIAYYAFVSIIPLALLAVAVASVLGGPALVQYVTEFFGRQLSVSQLQGVSQVLADTTGRQTASAVGLLALTWSGLQLFRNLDLAFDELYAGGDDTSILEQVMNAVVVGLGITLAVVLVVVVSIALTLVSPQPPFFDLFGTVVLTIALTIALLPVYYVLPPTDVSLREILPGAAVAAVGWVLLQVGFRIYASSASRYAAYGMIGGVLLFVTWLYFASIIVLVGGAVNAVRQEIPRST